MTLQITANFGFTYPQDIQYYRVPHDIERKNWNTKDFLYMGDGYRDGPVRQPVINADDSLPEVYRLDPDIHVILDCAWQRLWRDLNPMLSDRRWSSLLGNALAWTNNTGFPGKRNCITGEDSDEQFPRFDQQRTCGGAIHTGIERSGMLLIDSMLVDNRVPTVEEVLDNPSFWYWGTSINPHGKINLIPRLGIDGNYYPVRVPNVTKTQVFLPLNELHKLPLGSEIPSPTWLP